MPSDSHLFPCYLSQAMARACWESEGYLRGDPKYNEALMRFSRHFQEHANDVKVTAYVSYGPDSMGIDGHLGVVYLEAEHQYRQPYTKAKLEEMMTAISSAESNLLRHGIPFTDGYRFGPDPIEGAVERSDNGTLRARLGLASAEADIAANAERAREGRT